MTSEAVRQLAAVAAGSGRAAPTTDPALVAVLQGLREDLQHLRPDR
jgi:hypothetical protein